MTSCLPGLQNLYLLKVELVYAGGANATDVRIGYFGISLTRY